MAFDVTPTSGEGPYTFTASYANKLGFDLGLYVTEFRTATNAGSCPLSNAVTTNTQPPADELLATGVTISSANVPSGSCRRYVNLIRRVSDGVVVSQMFVNIDNVV